MCIKPMNSIEQIKEELLLCSEQRAEALRAYLELEEARRRSEELLDRALGRKIERKQDFCI